MGSRVRGILCLAVLVALVLVAPPGQAADGASPPADGGAHNGPATRNAAVAALMSSGFSSVTDLHRDGNVWVGQGVRHAVLVHFRIDGKGVESSHGKP